jgi:hypothetical protein
MPKPPYLLLAFDVDATAADGDGDAESIIADVEAGFPANARPRRLAVEHLYAIEVPVSKASDRFFEVGMYLGLKDSEHGGVVRWALQLCRADEFAEG